MTASRDGRRRRAGPPPPGRIPTREEIAQKIREMKGGNDPGHDYRRLSLEIHGLICAKCAREFSWEEKSQLTVHHIDGDDSNNPADGSNWENLCIYCHEAEHSRGRLGDYLRGDD